MKAAPVLFLLCAGLGWLAGDLRSPRVAPTDNAGSTPRALIPGVTALTEAPPIAEPNELGFEALGNLFERLEAADIAELRRWFALLPPEAYALKGMIVRRWATLDPEDAFATLRADSRFHNDLRTVLSTWAERDLGAALDAHLEVASLIPHSTFWESLDPEDMARLCTLMEERGLPETHRKIFDQLLPRLAETDPERAARLALKSEITDDPFGDNTMAKVLEKWTRSDPAAALRWAETQDNPELIRSCATKWLHTDPLAALKAYGGTFSPDAPPLIPTGSLSEARFSELMQWMADSSVGRPDANALYAGMLRGLESGEHPERLALIEPLLRGTSFETYGIQNAAVKWAVKDTDGLLAYINDASTGPARDAAIAGLCSHLARTDANRALEFLAGLESVPQGIEAYDLVRKALEQGHDYAEVVRRLPESLRGNSLQNLVFNLDEIGSIGQSVGALELLPDAKERESSSIVLAGVWARQDPRAAAVWVGEMPASETRALAAENLARFWAMTDPAAAAGWALSLDDPASRSRAVHGAADYLAGIEPQRALELAAQVTDAQLRGTVQSNALQTLARQNPDLAGKLLEATAMSDANRRAALQQINEMRALHTYLESAK